MCRAGHWVVGDQGIQLLNVIIMKGVVWWTMWVEVSSRIVI